MGQSRKNIFGRLCIKMLNEIIRGRPRLVGPRLRNRRFYANKPAPSARLGARTAARKATRTKTSTALVVQRRRQNQLQRFRHIENPGGYITQSNFKAYRKPALSAAIQKYAAMPSYYITNASDSLSVESGFQNAIFTALNNQSYFANFYSLMPSPTPIGNRTRRFVLIRSQAQVAYTNSTSVSCTMDLYDISVKRDNDLLNPLAAWANGMALQTTTPDPYKVLGAKPWQSQQFKEFFKIVKTTRVNLAPGATHKHNITLAPNQVIREQLVLENNCYKGLTMFTLAVVKGVPVSAILEPPPPPPAPERLVSTAPIRIDVVVEYNTKLSVVQDFDSDISITDNLVTLVNPDTMNTFGSAAAPITEVN